MSAIEFNRKAEVVASEACEMLRQVTMAFHENIHSSRSVWQLCSESPCKEVLNWMVWKSGDAIIRRNE